MALKRSMPDRMVAGVCSGLAKFLGWDVTIVRVLYVLISVASAAFPGILVYLVLWVLMPRDDS
ncbi:MAG: PspC domain-containing protein [Phycisphaerales bacterium]|nr:PspC domain-containing protein [Phycisphaerales bacterium]